MTPLMLAAADGNVGGVAKLLGADDNDETWQKAVDTTALHACARNGWTALMHAAAADNADVVRLLVSAGARVDAVSKVRAWLFARRTRCVMIPTLHRPSYSSGLRNSTLHSVPMWLPICCGGTARGWCECRFRRHGACLELSGKFPRVHDRVFSDAVSTSHRRAKHRSCTRQRKGGSKSPSICLQAELPRPRCPPYEHCAWRVLYTSLMRHACLN